MQKKAELIAAVLQQQGKGKPASFENRKKTGKGKKRQSGGTPLPHDQCAK